MFRAQMYQPASGWCLVRLLDMGGTYTGVTLLCEFTLVQARGGRLEQGIIFGHVVLRATEWCTNDEISMMLFWVNKDIMACIKHLVSEPTELLPSL